jgi:hypothetical protein
MEDATGRPPRPDLFTASLSGGSAEAGFSQRAAFFVAFFGGPFAAVAFHAWNAHLWGRVAKDLPWVAATSLLSAAFVAALSIGSPGPGEAGSSRDLTRLLSRAAALGVWGIFTLRHRALHRAQGLSGLAPRSPWLPGLACAGAGTLATIAIVAAARLLGQPS